MLEPTPEMLRRVLALLVENVEVVASDCWLYGDREYPRFVADGRSYLLHRAVYALFVGPIPDGFTVDHECHNRDRSCRLGWMCPHRRCVNPAHLAARTSIENAHAATSTRLPRRECRQGPIGMEVVRPRPRVDRSAPPVRRPRKARHPGRDAAAPWIATRDLARVLGVDGDNAATHLGQYIYRELRVRATEPRDMPDGTRARGYFVVDVQPLLDRYTPGV